MNSATLSPTIETLAQKNLGASTAEVPYNCATPSNISMLETFRKPIAEELLIHKVKSATKLIRTAARQGVTMRIHPLYGIRGGTCTCSKGANCPTPGKHPKMSGWQELASNDREIVYQMLEADPYSNLGIVTGDINGVLVVDLDGVEGLHSWQRFSSEHTIPEAPTVATGGGKHLYFKMPLGIKVSNSVKAILPSVDIRANGKDGVSPGNVVAPESRHISGATYQWEVHPNDVPFPECPAPLLELLRQCDNLVPMKAKIVGTMALPNTIKPFSRMQIGNIAEKLKDEAESVIESLLGSPVSFSDDEWLYHAPYRIDNNPSLRVNLSKGGVWYDDPQEKGGDLITLAALIWGLDTKKDFAKIVAALATIADIEPDDDIQVAELDNFAAQYGLDWCDFEAAGCAIKLDISFQIDRNWCKIPAVEYPLFKVVAAKDTEAKVSKIKSLQRFQNGKPSGPTCGKRLSRHLPGGSGFFPAKIDSKSIVLTAGEEKALALIRSGFPGLSLSTGEATMKKEHCTALRDLGVESVIVIMDADETGRSGAQKCAKLLYQEGIADVKIVLWSEDTPPRTDINDVLLKKGVDGVRELVGSAIPFTSISKETAKPQIDTSLDFGIQVQKACKVLEKIPGVFSRQGFLVEVLGDRIRQLSSGRISEILDSAVEFGHTVQTKDGADWRSEHCPKRFTEIMLARGRWDGIQEINAMSIIPVLLGDGSVHSTPGAVHNGILYLPTKEFPPIPEDPGVDDARNAIHRLLALVVDFPFRDHSHRSAWLAMILTGVGRHAFSGGSPMFVIDANSRKVGKSLLANVAACILDGKTWARTAYTTNEEELEKRLTSFAVAGVRTVFFDNVTSELGGAALDGTVTAGEIESRLLGGNELVRLPLRPLWIVTGNNITVKDDAAARIAHIVLQTTLERPETRTGFTLGDEDALVDHVRLAHPELVVSAITILKAYINAGRPSIEYERWGGFASWASLVCAALVWAGETDPGETRQEIQNADGQLAALRTLMDAWSACDSGRGLTVGKAVEIAAKNDTNAERQLCAALAEFCGTRGLPDPKTLGYALRKVRHRVVDSLRFNGTAEKSGIRWLVEPV